MLTVDFDRLGLLRGERLLDLGAGRRTPRVRGDAARRARHRARLLRRRPEGRRRGRGRDDRGRRDHVRRSGPASSTPTRSTSRSPTNVFDRVIVSEVLEHIWDDERALIEIARVLRPGGRIAATVPTRWPERVSWAINWHYHDTPGGHVRIYRQHELEPKLERAGFFLRGSHHAHAFHSPYWWLKCAYGLDNTEAPPVRRYHDFLCMLIEHNPRWASVTERALNPVLGKSVVLYGEKVAPSMARWGKRSLD